MKRLEGKTALVTGAGRGMGREIALRMAAEGADLVINYSGSKDAAEATVAAIEGMGRLAVAIQADIARREEVVAMFAKIDDVFGRIDVVVNSAGVSDGGRLGDLDDARLEWMLGVNLRGPLYIASEASKRLGQGGRIINIGSTMSEFPMAGTGVYSATKAALKSMTTSWSKELGAKGVTVNLVIPGATSPGMAERTPEAYRKMFESTSPFGRIGHAGEIAAVVIFLASDEASWVSGAHILANGAGSM